MTRRNSELVRAHCAIALALSDMPVDALPELAKIEVVTTHADGLRAELQLGVHADTVNEDVDAVLAWRDAIPGATYAAEAMHSTPDSRVHIAAVGMLGGVPVEVWTIVAMDPAVGEVVVTD